MIIISVLLTYSFKSCYCMLTITVRYDLFNFIGKRNDANVLADWERSKQGYFRTTLVGADSTGAAGKIPRFMRHNGGQSIILPRYYPVQFNTNGENCCYQERFSNWKCTKTPLPPGQLCPGLRWESFPDFWLAGEGSTPPHPWCICRLSTCCPGTH